MTGKISQPSASSAKIFIEGLARNRSRDDVSIMALSQKHLYFTFSLQNSRWKDTSNLEILTPVRNYIFKINQIRFINSINFIACTTNAAKGWK